MSYAFLLGTRFSVFLASGSTLPYLSRFNKEVY